MIYLKEFKIYLTISLLIFASACDNPSYYPKTEVNALDIKGKNLYNSLKDHEYDAILKNDSTGLAIYMMDILRVGRPQDSLGASYLNQFLANEDMLELGRQMDSVHQDLSGFEKSLAEALAYYNFYFNLDQQYDVYYVNSGFNAGAFYNKGTILMGLDMYLGKENSLLKRLPPDRFAQYIKDKMEPEFMVGDVLIQAIAEQAYQEPPKANMLEYMIAYGKIQYLLDLCMPYTADHIKMRYSPEEWEYASKSEDEIWKFIVREKYLYSNEYDKYNAWFSIGPFTSPLAQDSPDRIGTFMGWMMMRNFMEQHPDLTVKEIINLKSEAILKEYNP